MVKPISGQYTLDGSQPVQEWGTTLAYHHFLSNNSLNATKTPQTTLTRTCLKAELANGDAAMKDTLVIYDPRTSAGLQVGRIQEIIADVTKRTVIGFLLQVCTIGTTEVRPYRFPSLSIDASSCNIWCEWKVKPSLLSMI